MDFSHAGYKGGGVRIPDVGVARTVKPAAGDPLFSNCITIINE